MYSVGHLFASIYYTICNQFAFRIDVKMSAGFRKQPKGFATKAIHVGQKPEQWKSMCVIPPICLSTTYKQDGPGEHRVR